MSVDFEKIPPCVFELFDEIMWITAKMRGRGHVRCSNHREAWQLAWGWNPPLIKSGTNQLTSYGLAANAWRELQLQSTGQKSRPAARPGRPQKYLEALGVAKNMKEDGASMKEIYKHCKKLGIEVHEEFEMFRRDMQKKLAKKNAAK